MAVLVCGRFGRHSLTSSSVERNVELAEGSESVSIEVAGPMTIHPQQLPEGGHPPVGGHGVCVCLCLSKVGVESAGWLELVLAKTLPVL